MRARRSIQGIIHIFSRHVMGGLSVSTLARLVCPESFRCYVPYRVAPLARFAAEAR